MSPSIVILFGIIVVIIMIFFILASYKICALGLHDKEEVSSFLVTDYIRTIMSQYKYKPYFHQGNFDTHLSSIHRSIYGERKYPWDDKRIYNKVCIKCHKCFDNISIEKAYIENHIKKYVAKIDDERIRSKMAQDIYNEKCKGK